MMGRMFGCGWERRGIAICFGGGRQEGAFVLILYEWSCRWMSRAMAMPMRTEEVMVPLAAGSAAAAAAVAIIMLPPCRNLKWVILEENRTNG